MQVLRSPALRENTYQRGALSSSVSILLFSTHLSKNFETAEQEFVSLIVYFLRNFFAKSTLLKKVKIKQKRFSPFHVKSLNLQPGPAVRLTLTNIYYFHFRALSGLFSLSFLFLF